MAKGRPWDEKVKRMRGDEVGREGRQFSGGGHEERIGQAIDYLEAGLSGEPTVQGAALAAGLSRRHFFRLFREATGVGVEEYLRRRRLSRAALALTGTDRPILDLAMEAGYNSQSAFTRAFAREFGIAPVALRKAGREEHPPRLDIFQPVEPRIPFEPAEEAPSIEELPALALLCLRRNTHLGAYRSFSELPLFWEDWFSRRPWREIEGLAPGCTHYGLSRSDDGRLVEYLIGVEAPPKARPPGRWERIATVPGTYAVFTARGELPQAIQKAILGAYRRWLPGSGYRRREGWDIERYAATGGSELLVPIEADDG